MSRQKTTIVFKVTPRVKTRIVTEIGWVMKPRETYAVYRFDKKSDWVVSTALRPNGEVNGSLAAHNKTELLAFTPEELGDAKRKGYIYVVSVSKT
jgi:hypothetical protein